LNISTPRCWDTPGLQERVFVRDHLSVIADRSVRFASATAVS
jgi:hypothetical protein